MDWFIAIGVMSVVFAGAKAFCDVRGHRHREFVFKLLASLCFLCCGVIAILLNPENLEYGIFILCALIFGAIGDIMLCMDAFFPKGSYDEGFFGVVGTANFFVGHVIYLILLYYYAPISQTPHLLIALPVLPLIMLAVILSGKITLSKTKSFLMIFYFLVLGGTIIGGASFFLGNQSDAGIIVLVATVLFTFSDILLGLKTYCPAAKIPPKVAPFFVMISYCSAQVLYGLSVFFL